MSSYFTRILTHRDARGEAQSISDAKLSTLPEPLVVIGEPGMGKSRLLLWLADKEGWPMVSASFFVNHPAPAQLVKDGSRIIIDGLDELAAQKESDPINRVLGRLIAAGSPAFVLSCRAADWRSGAAKRDIPVSYGCQPRELVLEPFTRASAVRFLTTTLGEARADEVADYLEKHEIPDLYGNPLTLGLFAEVAARDTELPKSRAELLERAVSIMWSEHSEGHDQSALFNLDQDSALTAAGAACAAYILTGSGAILTKPSVEVSQTVLKVAEIQALPGGTDVRAVLTSRLFVAVPGHPDWFKPIHRMVAEFLGARWLSHQARDDQARDRVLALLTSDGGVPASLRGIHAWLSRDPAFAPAVIALDPYGVLRYGDADGLSPAQGRLLLAALKTLQEEDPFFRAEDWAHHAAMGLTHPDLQSELSGLLRAPETGYHLRTLLLGAIRGADLVPGLRDAVREVTLGSTIQPFCYVERRDAFAVMRSWSNVAEDWEALVERLINQRRGDSARLAFNVMVDVGFARFTVEQIGRVILSSLGLEPGHTPDDEFDQVQLYRVSRRLMDVQVVPLLDYLAAATDTIGTLEHGHAMDELIGIRNHLVERAIAIKIPSAIEFLSWLRIAGGNWSFHKSGEGKIADFLAARETLRRDMQWHVSFTEVKAEDTHPRVWDLDEIHPSLALSVDDVIYQLQRLAQAGPTNAKSISLWRALARLGMRDARRTHEVLTAAGPFAASDPDLKASLDDLVQPASPAAWEVERESRRLVQEERETAAVAAQRERWVAHADDLLSGASPWIYDAGTAYFGLAAGLDKSILAPDRIVQAFGEELSRIALKGLEAVLFRQDLPSAIEVSHVYANGQRPRIIQPLMAGIGERFREDRGLEEIDVEVLLAVRVGLVHERHLLDRIKELQIEKRLDEELQRRAVTREQCIRTLIEPQLSRRETTIDGLFQFCRDERNRGLVVRLAVEWLRNFPNMAAGGEYELVRVLALNGHFLELAELGRARGAVDYIDDAQRMLWWVLNIFSNVPESSDGSPVDPELLWVVKPWLRSIFWTQHPRPALRVELIVWVIQSFRTCWPLTNFPSGVWSGENNAWDASQFILDLINELSGDSTDAALTALSGLIAGGDDPYTPSMRHAFRLQRQARRETTFAGITIPSLRHVIAAQAPVTVDDLVVVVKYALGRLQAELRGSDTDPLTKYWSDNGTPRSEDYCTDRLVEDLMRLIPPYGITRETQADMPRGKRADVLLSVGGVALPIECKGQWHRDLWSAAEDQLEALYLEDSRTRDRGIFLVYWFGSNETKRLTPPPDGLPVPATAQQLQEMLTARLSPERRNRIVVAVLDFDFPR